MSRSKETVEELVEACMTGITAVVWGGESKLLPADKVDAIEKDGSTISISVNVWPEPGPLLFEVYVKQVRTRR